MPVLTKAGILAKGLLTRLLGGGAETVEGVASDLLENFVDKPLRRTPDLLRAAVTVAEADIPARIALSDSNMVGLQQVRNCTSLSSDACFLHFDTN